MSHCRRTVSTLRAVVGQLRKYSSKSECDSGRQGLVLGAYELGQCPKLTPTAERYNDKVSGKLVQMIKEVSDMRKGKGKGHVFNNLDSEFVSVCIVEIGKKGAGYNQLEIIDEGREDVRVAVATGVTRLRKEGMKKICVEDMGGYAQEAAEAATLAACSYQEFKSKKHRKVIPSVEPYESNDTEGWKRGLIFGQNQNLARRLCEAPGNVMTPTAFAQAVVDEVCNCAIMVDVRTKEWMEQRKFDAFLMVGKSSCEPPVMVEVMYCGAPQFDKPIILIGKGTTFDTGGLHLKKESNRVIVDEHRADMAGAAAIVGAIKGAAQLSLPMNIYGYLPLCENMISGMAMKPGDGIRSMSGNSILVHDTDFEGRLGMSDAVTWAQKQYKPRLVLNVGTMTTEVETMLGGGCCACWSNSKQAWKQMQKAGAITGDRVWRFPLWEHYRKSVMAFNAADLSNKGNQEGGEPCLAAAFLKEFVPCSDWMHLDITGVALPTKSPSHPFYRVGAMTGRPTRTILQFLYQLACPMSCDQKPKKQDKCDTI